jgi:SNF2 family DNA or RNA helicase
MLRMLGCVLIGDRLAPQLTQEQNPFKSMQNIMMQLRKICNHPYIFSHVETGINNYFMARLHTVSD